MTQSAVSQIIRQMEKQLGVVLIDREHRPLALTAAGKALHRKAELIVEEAEQLPAVVREAGLSRMPEIRIALVDSFAGTAGPSFIKVMLDSATRLAVWSGLSPSMGQALLAREVDLAVTTDPLEDVDGLDRSPLWHEPFILLIPKAISLAGSGVQLKRLAAEYPLIRYSARSHIGGQIERHLRRLRVTVDRRLEIDTSDAVVAMVAAGIGWAILTPLCLLQGRGHAERVQVVRLPGPRFVRSLVLVCRAGEYRDLSHRTAEIAKKVLRTECLGEIRRRWPWVANEIVLG